jgi:signal transduction histidine kinase
MAMLHELLKAHRNHLVRDCEARAVTRSAPQGSGPADRGIPRFLDQLIAALQFDRDETVQAAAPAPDDADFAPPPDVRIAAALHGHEMLASGYSVDAVVHSYGDLCEAISELAVQQGALMEAKEFRTLHRCLDEAIAHAVTEFSYQRDVLTASSLASREHERLDGLGDELRNLLGTATLAVSALKARDLPLGGATGTILERSLNSIGLALDRLLRGAGASTSDRDMLNMFCLRDLMEQVAASAAPAAAAAGRHLVLTQTDADLAVAGNRDSLRAALGSLLQTAFSRSAPRTDITLRAHAVAQRVLIDIAFACDALLAREQDPGLAVARELLLAEQGELLIQEDRGHGCTLTASLPRQTMPS